jgi:hypothetical protein
MNFLKKLLEFFSFPKKKSASTESIRKILKESRASSRDVKGRFKKAKKKSTKAKKKNKKTRE